MYNWNNHAQKLAESPCWFPETWNVGYFDRNDETEATRTASTLKVLNPT